MTGRVLDERVGRGVFFLERRRPGAAFLPRRPVGGVVIDYPFEPGPI